MTSFGEFFKVDGFKAFMFYLNNYCNLHCEYCSSLSHIPLNPDSPYEMRRHKWEMPVADVRLFCERFRGVGESDYHRLTGAEPTAMPIEFLEQIIEVLDSYGRRMWMPTNGFNMMGIDRAILNKIQRIELADHGINHDHIVDCLRYLKNFYTGEINMVNRTVHYDLEEAMRHPANRGKTCGDTMHTPELHHGTLYPCCQMTGIEAFSGGHRIRDELAGAGWTIDNPDVVEALRNWRQTLPRYVVDQCLNSCWRPNWRIGRAAEITLKPHDIVRM